jgi:DNA-binding PadR family transcriptional regulator
MEPLTPPVFHILLALADEDKHGYAIMQDVARQTENTLQLGPGTLYGCLKRMQAADLVADAGERDDADERRRYYRLTDSGRSALRDESERLRRAVSVARSRKVFA